MTIVDTLLHARWIIPVEPESVTYDNHSLVVDSGKIIDLLPTELAKQKYQGKTTENLENHAPDRAGHAANTDQCGHRAFREHVRYRGVNRG